LRTFGGHNAVISYLEYVCLECGPTRAIIDENALINKRRDDAKKGIEVEKPTIQEQMLEQQNEIYAVNTATKDKLPDLKHVSP